MLNKFNVNGQEISLESGSSDLYTVDTSTADLQFADESGNVLVSFENGHIKTKNFDSSNINIDTLEKITQEPISSIGQLNVIKRCRQMCDVKWTPVANIPRQQYTPFGNQDHEDIFKAGTEYTGIPYTRANKVQSGYSNNFIGLYIPLESFLTSIRNINSVIYKESKFDASNNRSVAYGLVCSGLASYAYGFKTEKPTSTIHQTDFTKIGNIYQNSQYIDINKIQLADMLNYPGFHVSIVTDIIRDDNKNIIGFEISEATPIGRENENIVGGLSGGVCRRKYFTLEQFFDRWKNYGLYRYNKLSQITYTKSEYVSVGFEAYTNKDIDFSVIPYMGENYQYKRNYIYNSTLLVETENYTHLAVFKDGEPFNSDGTNNMYTINNNIIDVGFSETGKYEAQLVYVKNDSIIYKSNKCHWTVI